MSDFVSPSAGQTGVPRLEEKAPTFDFFQWVASSVSVEDGSEREGFEDEDGAMATHGGMDPGVMVAGTLLLHAQKRMPMKGDVMLAKDEEGFWEGKYLEVAECQASGLVNGRPAACEVTMMWNAAKQAEYEAAGVADLDGPPKVVVTGDLTSDGTTPFVFPEMVLVGDAGGRPYYEDESGNFLIIWSVGAGLWQLGDFTNEVFWTSSEDVPTPDLVTTWTPDAPATGTPVLEFSWY